MRVLHGAIGLLFSTLSLLACSGGGSPETVAKKFAEATFENDIDTMYELIQLPDDIEGKEDRVRGKLQMMNVGAVAESTTKGGVDEIRVGDAEYNDDKTRATVQVTVKFNKDGEPERTQRINLVQDDGDWKVRL